MSNMKKMLLVLSVVLLVFSKQTMPAHAYGVLAAGNNIGAVGPGVYSEVIVNGNRYYYNHGSFYTGSQGSYVLVQAPDGAVVAEMPVGYESVVMEGNPYYRYNNVYYRHGRQGGYEVVGNNRFHDQGQHSLEGSDQGRNH